MIVIHVVGCTINKTRYHSPCSYNSFYSTPLSKLEDPPGDYPRINPILHPCYDWVTVPLCCPRIRPILHSWHWLGDTHSLATQEFIHPCHRWSSPTRCPRIHLIVPTISYFTQISNIFSNYSRNTNKLELCNFIL